MKEATRESLGHDRRLGDAILTECIVCCLLQRHADQSDAAKIEMCFGMFQGMCPFIDVIPFFACAHTPLVHVFPILDLR